MTDPTPIADFRAASAGWHIQRLSGWIDREMSARLAPLGLTHRDFALLMSVLETPGQTQAMLAAGFAMPDYAVSRSLNALEAKGLIARVPASRRAHAILPTEAAQALLPRLQTQARALNRALLAPLDDREAALLRSLMARMLAAKAPGASGA